MSRRIAAPAARIFEVIADPARHPRFDGSGMLRDGGGNGRIRAVGDVFSVRMHNDEMGDYEMDNHVVVFEPGRRIVWEPAMRTASRPEDQGDVGQRAGHQWGFILEPDGTDATHVTETYDCSCAPEWLRKAVKGGERWVAAMTRSLELLEQEARDRR